MNDRPDGLRWTIHSELRLGPAELQLAYGTDISMHLRTIKFEVGELVVTPTAAAAIAENGVALDALMQRHQSGDWGEVSSAIQAVNQRALADQFNLQSGYALPDGRRVVIVTNRDRSATIVHLDVM